MGGIGVASKRAARATGDAEAPLRMLPIGIIEHEPSPGEVPEGAAFNSAAISPGPGNAGERAAGEGRGRRAAPRRGE
jgi:hypothetical protein